MSDFYTNVAVSGDNLLFSGVLKGKKVRQKIPFKPALYFKSASNQPKDSPYKTMYGEPLSRMDFDSITEAREFVHSYKEVDNFHIYGNPKFEYDYIAEKFSDLIDPDISKINVVNIDIEVSMAGQKPKVDTAFNPVTAICCKFSNHDNYIVFGLKGYKKHRDDVEYIHCRDEVDLLERFLTEWNIKSPDVITGWNVKTFDMPYLVNRMKRVLAEGRAKELSPWRRISERQTTFFDKDVNYYEFTGISILDCMEMYRKFAPRGKQESYKLDYIASVELGERKLSYEEYEGLQDLYEKNHQKYIEYNIRDVELVGKIEKKFNLLGVVYNLAYDSGTNFADVFMQVRMWTEIVQKELRRDNIFTQISKRSVSSGNSYEGAYVKPTQIGEFQDVGSFDLESLYPKLTIMYNISPETLIPTSSLPSEIRSIMSTVSVESLLDYFDTSFLLENDWTITPNQQLFDTRVQGFLARIMARMFDERKKYKKLMLEAEKELEARRGTADEATLNEIRGRVSKYQTLQQVKKICLNSGYGAIGSPYFFLFDVRLAEAITLAGQLSIRWIGDSINAYLNRVLKTEGKDYIIASDTDSIYIYFGPLVEAVLGKDAPVEKRISFMDKVCEQKLKPFIENRFQDLAVKTNAFEQTMNMKREALASRGIWTAKKRYALNVYNNEGVQYAKPKVKIVGIEAVKSSTPSSCRDKIREAIDLIMTGSEADLQKFVADFRNEFRKTEIEGISFPRSVNGLDKYFDSKNLFKTGTPIHVKGSLIYNKAVKEHNLENKYSLIEEGDQIKFIYLKEPNIFRSPVIAFSGIAPRELKLDALINYDLQFEKSFLEPLNSILTHINWKPEKVNSLDDFFA